ncbi:MAG: chemotaxis response regulator protein-glutamate methylesterase [Dehalococcoidales bacterium]|nr:chemotaxis response regulator protein-glutamate methylesterase [Dehalococcoidales bacterium]
MPRKIRVLVVDDSSYVIFTLTKKLESSGDMEVIGAAHNGVEAIEKVKTLSPDVVTMDIVMPEMDGITALKHIMAECPTPVVMLSALTRENAEPTLLALEAGAVDFYLKPSILEPGGKESDDSLLNKIRHAASVSFNRGRTQPALHFTPKRKPREAVKDPSFGKVVVIGSSTGGPRALMYVVPSLPEDINAAILIVQHMPPLFTRSLAERLDLASRVRVAEAKEGDRLERGLALLAPGDYHMTVDEKGVVHLNQEPPHLGVRPAVDNTMRAVAASFRERSLGVVLTGMGTDGTIGASMIKAAGGRVLVQDEATSTVYGMPASVAQAGLADRVLPLDKIAGGIAQECG